MARTVPSAGVTDPSDLDPASSPGNEVLRSMLAAQAADPTPEGRGAALVALLDAELLLVTPDAPAEPGTAAVVALDVVSMVMAEDGGGHAVVPTFTGLDAALAWQPDGVVCTPKPALELLRIAAADPVGKVGVDLGSPGELVLEPQEVAALAEGSVPGVAPGAGPAGGAGAGQVLVATLPEEVADAVRAAVAAEPGVVRAALFVVDQGTGGDPRSVVVQFAPGSDFDEAVPAAMGRIVEAVAARTDAAAGLTLTLATPEWGDAFAEGGIELFSRPR